MIIYSTLRNAANKSYDIVITGAGMVGSVLACSLANNPTLTGFSILLLESSKKKLWNPPSAYSNRVSTINDSSKRLLQRLELWDQICNIRSKPLVNMKVWGNGSNSLFTVFDSDESNEVGVDLGYVVENDVIVNTSLASLDTYKDFVDVLYESRIKEFNLPRNDGELVHITLEDGSTYSCSLLIGADGYNSKVRQAMGVQYLSWSYNQKGIVATLELETDINDTAWQKFTVTGPVALLPLTDKLSSLVWTTTLEMEKNLSVLSDESFVDALNSALWEPPESNPFVNSVSEMASNVLRCLNLDDAKRVEILPPTVKSVAKGSRASFPLGFGHSVSYVAPRVALVGDAAHKIHPLAGQGVNIGFGDVICLTDTLAKYISAGYPLGFMKSLAEYETIRQRANFPKMLGIDVIQKVAGHTFPPLMAANHIAFQLTNAVPLVKKFLIKQAAV